MRLGCNNWLMTDNFYHFLVVAFFVTVSEPAPFLIHMLQLTDYEEHFFTFYGGFYDHPLIANVILFHDFETGSKKHL